MLEPQILDNIQDSPVQKEKLLDSENFKISIDPLSFVQVELDTNAEVTAKITWPRPAEIIFKNGELFSRSVRRPRAKPFPGEFPPDSKDIVRLLNGSRRDWKQVPGLPYDRIDTSVNGTRGLKCILPSFPDDVICLTGIGVVKAAKNENGGVDQKNLRLLISAPEKDTPVSKFMRVGTNMFDSEGNAWNETNNSPLGAYPIDSLKVKIDKTKTLGSKYGPKVLAAGEYQGTDMGWMAYALPKDALSPVELLLLDLKLPKEHQGKLYGKSVEVMFQQVKDLHDHNIVHYQLHPGNWYAQVKENGATNCIFTDWETATSLDSLPPPTDFKDRANITKSEYLETQFADLQPKEKALALDLLNAFTAITLPETDNFKHSMPDSADSEKLSAAIDRLGITLDSLKLQMKLLAYALAGYAGKEVTDEYLAQASEQLYQQLSETTIRVSKQMGFSETERLESIVAMEHSDWVMKDAVQEILIEISKRLATSRSKP